MVWSMLIFVGVDNLESDFGSKCDISPLEPLDFPFWNILSEIFKFSILDSDEAIIQQLNDNQGKFVKVEYVERYRSFYWWGDTHFFISKVEIIPSPYK